MRLYTVYVPFPEKAFRPEKQEYQREHIREPVLDPAAREDAANMPGWIAVSYDGRYVYPEGGEVIDTRTLRIVTVMKNGGGLYEHSAFEVEVDFNHGRAIRAGDQFGVGRVR